MECKEPSPHKRRSHTAANPRTFLDEEIMQLNKLRGQDLELNAEKYPIETKIFTDTKLKLWEIRDHVVDYSRKKIFKIAEKVCDAENMIITLINSLEEKYSQHILNENILEEIMNSLGNMQYF